MIFTRKLFGCLILVACYLSVTGLCSTCLDKLCYDNGECIIGCVPGYIGEYCSEMCPERCLNKVCHLDRTDGAVICTDGCRPGYCHTTCSVRCQKGCVTCDRECSSCNVTLCPERRYGVDCGEICSPRYGKCDRETGQCIECRRGYYGDDCDQKCTACFTRAETIIDTCLSGCDICQSEETCPAGFHGNSCELQCSTGCETSGHGCNRATGECSAECVSGYHGLTCNYTCGEHCQFGKCNRATGECSNGCVSGYHGLTCNYTYNEHCQFGKCNGVTGECSAGCVSGYHGLTCNFTCSEHCLFGKCDAVTGECSDGCVSGYHGRTCNSTCNKFCLSRICNQHDGVCTYGCMSGYRSNLDTCAKYSEGVSGSHTPIAIGLSITIVCLVVFIVSAAFLWRRRFRRFNKPIKVQVEEGTSSIAVVTEPLLDYTKETSQTANFAEPLLKNTKGTSSIAVVSEPLLKYTKEDSVELLSEDVQQLRTRTRAEVDFVTGGMVRVSAVDTVLQKLKAGQRWVTITGNAGDGKSVVGYLVLKEFLQKNVYVFSVYKPEEYDQIVTLKGDRIIMFDDRFGAFVADEHLIKSWLDVLRNLLNFNEGHTSVIFVSRKNVVNESRMFLGKFSDKMYDPECVIDLSQHQMHEERLAILDYHLEQENVTVNDEPKMRVCDKVIAHGFPHCCSMFSKLTSTAYKIDIEDFFESPLKFLDMTTRVLYKANCKDLFQMLIKNDGKFNVYTVEDEDKRQELLEVEKEQEGSYITVWKDGICSFAHPSVYESVLSVINDIDPLYCVQYATLSTIRQKMLISTSDIDDSSRSLCYLTVKPIPIVMKALAERFREKMTEGDYSVFKTRLCQSREFCEALVSCCVSTDENEFRDVSKRFINKPGEDGETMLWTALKNEGMMAVQILVKAGAAVNIPDEIGRTPLHYLCQLKNSPAVDDDDGDDQSRVYIDTIKVIIAEGKGDVNSFDKYRQTPLHYLFKWPTLSQEDIQWIITEVKGDLNKCEQNKSTPLHYLCGYSRLQMDTVDLVIKVGKGDFNKGDEYGTTPFHFLCGNRKVEFDVVLLILNTEMGDINKQDANGITPLHILCKGTLPMESILTLIKQGYKSDSYGNTPLHYLCKRREINADSVQKLFEKIPDTDIKKQNILGHTPLDYLTNKESSLPWVDGMLQRFPADLVLCRVKQGDKWRVVLGSVMTLSSMRVNRNLQVEDFGRELSSLADSDKQNTPGRFLTFCGTCSSLGPLHPYVSTLTNISYWETHSRLKWNKNIEFIILEMGLVEGRDNLDKESRLSHLPGSVCVSVWVNQRQLDRLCIQVWRTDQEGKRSQVSKTVTLPPLTPDTVYNFKFGLVLDTVTGRVAFLDVEKGAVLGKLDLEFTQDVSPMFYISPDNSYVMNETCQRPRDFC